jgi:hypothetical protein
MTKVKINISGILKYMTRSKLTSYMFLIKTLTQGDKMIGQKVDNFFRKVAKKVAKILFVT